MTEISSQIFVVQNVRIQVERYWNVNENIPINRKCFLLIILSIYISSSTFAREKNAFHHNQFTCRQFHQHFTYEFFERTSFWQLFSSYIYITCLTFVRTTCAYKVDEIDGWSRVSQHFTHCFYTHKSQKC